MKRATAYERGLRDGARRERRRIRVEVLAALRAGRWLWRDSVTASVESATTAPTRRR